MDEGVGSVTKHLLCATAVCANLENRRGRSVALQRTLKDRKDLSLGER